MKILFFWPKIMECLTSGPCRARLKAWIRKYGIAAVVLSGWMIWTVILVVVVLDLKTSLRKAEETMVGETPYVENLSTPLTPPVPPSQEVPKAIPRHVPDNLKGYVRDRLKSIK